MNPAPLYPLRFEPIFQYRNWGGRRLDDWLTTPLLGNEPIGEARVLSDRDNHPSVVSEGAFKSRTIAKLIEERPDQMFCRFAGRFSRFPLLLKFLDARDTLSVQVHPSDEKTEYISEGKAGKTESCASLPLQRRNFGLKRLQILLRERRRFPTSRFGRALSLSAKQCNNFVGNLSGERSLAS